jgi:hypothetical protein
VTNEEGKTVVGETVYADPIGRMMIGIAPQRQNRLDWSLLNRPSKRPPAEAGGLGQRLKVA